VIKLIANGIDPAIEARRVAQAEADNLACTFGAVAADFLGRYEELDADLNKALKMIGIDERASRLAAAKTR